jgi:hypothetical protein
MALAGRENCQSYARILSCGEAPRKTAQPVSQRSDSKMYCAYRAAGRLLGGTGAGEVVDCECEPDRAWPLEPTCLIYCQKQLEFQTGKSSVQRP